MNSVFLVALCFSIFINAVKRFVVVERLNRPLLILGAGSLGLLINVFGMFLFYGHSQEDVFQEEEKGEEPAGTPPTGHEYTTSLTTTRTPRARDVCDVTFPAAAEGRRESGGSKKSEGKLVMKVVLLDKMGDSLGSIIVIVGALLLHFVGEDHRWTMYVDPVLSILMVAIILHSSLPLLKESSLILLQNVPPKIQFEELKGRLLASFPEILGLHDFHVWQLVGEQFVASLHVALPEQV